MLYTDIPTADEFAALDAARGDICVSIYLPTSPVTRATKADRILLKNLASSAIDQLVKAKANKRRVAAIADSLAELESDRQFWAYLADGLAIFVTPGAMRTFRLPHAPEPEAQVSDRFHIKPLVPTLAQQGHCFVLALSQGAVRLIEITPSFAKQVKAADLPKTMSQVLKRRFPRDPAPARRIQGGEGMKVLMGQYCRAIDRALRPVLMSQTAPLILASVSELAAIYRAHNSYPALEKSVITGNPEELTDAELAAKARPAVSRLEKRRIRDRLSAALDGLDKDLASADLAQVARAAIRGQVQTLFVDENISVPGRIDSSTGELFIEKESSADSYDVLDELVGLVMRNGGSVLPSPAQSMPANSPVLATFRFRA